MGTVTQEAIDQFKALMDQAEEPLKRAFQHIHQGYPTETLARFLKAREGNVTKAHKMLVDCLKWRVESEIENMLAKPIVPTDLYRAVRDSQLIGLSGYSREGLPVFAIGVGLSTLDKASVHYYVQSHIQINEYRDCVILPSATKKSGRHISKCLKVLDMTGLKLSALSQIKLLSIISTIDDLNYPEKTLTYYIVNAPYIFSACWKVVKPLLHERTRKKIQVLSGSGQDDLLKLMDYAPSHIFAEERALDLPNIHRMQPTIAIPWIIHFIKPSTTTSSNNTQSVDLVDQSSRDLLMSATQIWPWKKWILPKHLKLSYSI
ncbi:Phosphatidylinositol/phosphatidylcholine transfer protein SFH2 [Camellia lanceoleosa]|uniref:Phosphatidylinositol/phosphatidylcholine transfer protein SFH2 n=1 Tax=Camellia lanceoleosa TaxID=1840588 RepID=A0ACC0GG03_9ERIC|nr:Phosphatidylinositol/phosphatidylcholine transfer protein SFH2 [Camellia lanceoleosa]